jgi:hypothetical protein
MTRGIHRVRNEPPLENGVWVSDGANTQEMRESTYQRRGYEPPLETLPWDTAKPAGHAARP